MFRLVHITCQLFNESYSEEKITVCEHFLGDGTTRPFAKTTLRGFHKMMLDLMLDLAGRQALVARRC